MELANKPDGASGAGGGAKNDGGDHEKKQGHNHRHPYKGHRNNNRPKQDKKPEPIVIKEQFTGRNEDLEGYVYSFSTAKGGLQFTRTTNKVARYTGEKYSAIGSYIRTAILTMTTNLPLD